MEYSRFIDKGFTYAVVGASNDKSKFGFKVLKDLKEAGYKVVPVNPCEKSILGLKVYSTLAEYPDKIDVVVLVVPPEVSKKIVHQCKELNICKVWMQPGSESDVAKKYCRDFDADCVWGRCIMEERRRI